MNDTINNLLTDELMVIRTLANKEIIMCNNKEDLLCVGKFWKNYFNEMNKWIAGKRNELPYCSEDGKSVI